MVKAKVCWKCKEFIIIHPDNVLSDVLEKKFDRNHPKHPTQIVNMEELDKNYQAINYEVFQNV